MREFLRIARVVADSLREQHPAMLGQQREHAARLNQMTGDRLGIKKLTLIKRTTLHTHIVPAPTIKDQDDTRCSAVS